MAFDISITTLVNESCNLISQDKTDVVRKMKRSIDQKLAFMLIQLQMSNLQVFVLYDMKTKPRTKIKSPFTYVKSV